MATFDIKVTLKPRGSIADDLDFSYAGEASNPAFAKVDQSGLIVIDRRFTGSLEVRFHIATPSITIGDKTYAISFKLKDAISQALHVKLSSGQPAPGGVITTPVTAPGDMQVSTTFLRRDMREYKYTLTVGAKESGGAISNAIHDPKIRNGGNVDSGAFPGHARLGLLAAAALTPMLWSLSCVLRRNRRAGGSSR